MHRDLLKYMQSKWYPACDSVTCIECIGNPVCSLPSLPLVNHYSSMARCPGGNASQVLCQLQLENREVALLIHFSISFENPDDE